MLQNSQQRKMEVESAVGILRTNAKYIQNGLKGAWMSKPRFDWWSNAVQMVVNYPTRKKEYEDLHSQSLTAGMSGMPSGTSISRTTESVALREMPPMKQKEYDAVTRAIEITKFLPDGEKRLELITRMYWKGGRLGIRDVIYHIGIGEATGKRWHARFIRIVGECVGYMN